MEPEISLNGIAAAMGLGLLIGIVRERAYPDPSHTVAGVRTHLMAALAGALGAALGTAVLVAVVLLLGALVVASYLKSIAREPGLTGEVALPVTALLAALAQSHTALAAGLSVVAAAVLFAKKPLHNLVRERVNEQEVRDALLLAAAALVVLPLLPTTAVDAWGVLVPARLWRMVVLILAVGMTGHLALRLMGARWGLPLAGFMAGFASSTAAVASFGHRARAEPAHIASAAAGALFANLGSLALFAAVISAAAPTLMLAIALPLGAAGLALALTATLGVLHNSSMSPLPAETTPRAFRLSHALLLAVLMSALLLVSIWLQRQFGSMGVLLASAAVALVEIHAAAASLAQLASDRQLSIVAASWGLVLLLAVSAAAKTVLAFASGGRSYGWRVAAGLLLVPLIATMFIYINYR